jgi:glutaconate CoA-transferase subunit B
MDMAERQAMTLQFLRPAEVGADGSANTSRLVTNGKLVRFPGGLALADVVNLMPRIVLYHTAHERRALPAEVGFRTCAGGGIERGGYTALGPTKVITDRCVIDFGANGPRLTSVHPGEDVAGVVAETGFALDAADTVETAAPSEAELAALDAVDPDRLRELELRKRRTPSNGSTASERSTNA